MPEKLKIEAYEDASCTAKFKGSIDAFLNPASYQRSFNVKYHPVASVADNNTTQNFDSIGAGDLNLSLFVDGTGRVPLESRFEDVDDYIDKFNWLVCGYQGSLGQPYFLMITWGKLIFTGVCIKNNVKYTLFSPEGKALRAVMDLTFKESSDAKTKAKEAAISSPNQTHVRTVNAGDTLPLMAYKIYGDKGHHAAVAKHNKLSSFFAIDPGDDLEFPSLDMLYGD